MKKEIFDYTVKNVKKKLMSSNKNNNSQNKHADSVIRNHVLWSMGAGFIPTPILDIFAVSALQMDMVKQLCNVYDKDFEASRGKAIVTSLTSTALARAGARSLIKLIPGVGTVIGGVAASIFNGASTYALGEVFKRHFEDGGTILDFDTDRLKKYYKEKFEKGKKVAEQLQKDEKARKEAEQAAQRTDEIVVEPTHMDSTADSPFVLDEIKEAETKIEETKKDIVAKLKELADLRDSGVITQEDFDVMKQKLIDKF